MNYYNEIDPYSAEWLRNFIEAGMIPYGDVDERSIEDVLPTELTGYTQCHFFAGIGIWSLALRTAGWPDDRPVWTGSSPCQPFSAAGKRNGFDDERHLWPAWYWLISQSRPDLIFGEQVDDAVDWLDLVSTDMEAINYAIGPIDFPAAGVGAPNIRQRLYWVADADSNATGRLSGSIPRAEAQGERQGVTDGRDVDRYEDGCGTRRMAQSSGVGWGWGRESDDGLAGWSVQVEGSGTSRDMEDWRRIVAHTAGESVAQSVTTRGLPERLGDGWDNLEWALCRDTKGAVWRCFERGHFPLSTRNPSTVGRLRAYGNSLNHQAAAAFVSAFLEARG
jgi:DNA (cytosine-5)-methyltransferase 1